MFSGDTTVRCGGFVHSPSSDTRPEASARSETIYLLVWYLVILELLPELPAIACFWTIRTMDPYRNLLWTLFGCDSGPAAVLNAYKLSV